MNNNQQPNKPLSDDDEHADLGIKEMIGSVLASFFGVQSSQNRQRDFQRGNAKKFIAVGIGMTAVWYGTISVIVSIILNYTS